LAPDSDGCDDGLIGGLHGADTPPDGRIEFGGGTAAHSTIRELESAGLEPVLGVTKQIGRSMIEPVRLSK